MLKKVLIPALLATSAMTLFSYLIGKAANENFSEAKLLAKLEKKKFALFKRSAVLAGWATHYAIGILMVASFNTTWKLFHENSGINRLIIASILGGGSALISWHLFFTALPKRSGTFYKQYYTQLYIAHVLFALTVITTQQASNGKSGVF